MAYILTPRFAPVYQAQQCNPFGFCAPVSRPTYAYRTVQRPKPRPSPFASFFSQFDELISEIDHEAQRQAQIEAQVEAKVEAQREAHRKHQAQLEAHIEAQREAHRQRQLRKRALRAQFSVTPNEQGWQVHAEIPGFEQDSISIEVTDETTLKIVGNTEWGAKPQPKAQSEVEATPAAEKIVEETTPEDKMNSIILNEPEVEVATETTTETESARPATPDSDTSSHKSYQATVEDDFEDLGAEASSLFSNPSEPVTPNESKGKDKAVETTKPAEAPAAETAVTHQSASEAPAQQQEREEYRPHGSFERTFRFPERIDANNVKASLEGGVLSITVPRAPAQQIRRITII